MFGLVKISAEGTIPNEVLHPPPFAVLVSGSVITMKLFSSDTVGVFIVDVIAYDRDKMNDTAQLRVYLISNYQRVKVVAGFKPNEMELNRESFIQKLSDALNMNVVVDKIATHTDSGGQQDPSRSDVYIHARYRGSGDIVPAYELWRAFDYYPQVQKVFTEFRVIETLPVQEENKASEEKDNLQRPFIIVAVALGCVVIVLILVLINTIRRYRRRLKAATTPAYMTSKQEPEVFVAPGTNKYYAAENPLYGQNFKTIDPDRLSNGRDSLDDNQVDGSSIADDEKEPEEEQEMYLDLNDDGRSPSHVNHLAMVIQQYEEQNNAKNSRDAPPTSPDKHDKGEYSGSKGRHSNGHVTSDRPIDQGAFDAYLHTDI
ncbi:cadherin-23-like isoform X1 [Pomacea canaliculata]|nr:cadherin-23-like isoform X1 [Pomacea canaliculata]